MGYAKNIMGAGIPAAAAAADTIASVATALTAAGTTQGTALSITADANFVSTVGASSGNDLGIRAAALRAAMRS